MSPKINNVLDFQQNVILNFVTSILRDKVNACKSS